MRADSWSRAEAVFQAAVDRTPEQRTTFLDQACAGDETLRHEVESLLSAYEKSEGFMEDHLLQAAAELIAAGPEQESSAAVGELVGSYKILSILGAGGMGEVYLAEDLKLGRKVALKLLPTDLSKDENRLRRFEREARLASNLTHPNISTIHEVNETEDGRHFIVMEYVEGITLTQYMKEQQIEPGKALDVAIQVCSALATAHEAGIIHRDIKPENIMLRPDGYVKVLDFGLAKRTEDQAGSLPPDGTAHLVETTAGLLMGTVCYMSPEQARGLELDARTDIFSLGVVIYQMVTGSLPFKGETMSDCLAAVLTTEPPPLSSYSASIPAELDNAVGKALQKDRDERYRAVEELALALRGVQRDLDLPAARLAGTQGPTGSSSLSSKRRKVAAFAVGAALLIGLIALGSYLRGRSAAASIDSIAVLPFENQNHDPDSEYLADGVTESIINNLTQLEKLRVIPRSSVFRFKGKVTDPIAVGQQLHVRAVLLGRLLQRDDTLTVNSELIDVRDNTQIWGEQYTRKLSDALSLQLAISQEISSRLKSKLTHEEQGRLAELQTSDPEAYQWYLKGRYYWNKRGPDNVKKALEQFDQATHKDPSYSLAYVGMANCYALLAAYRVEGYPPTESYIKARSFVERALHLDDLLAEAHACLAFINEFDDFSHSSDAEKEFKRAIELNPNYPTTHHWYSMHLYRLGQFDEALAEARRAQELDPLSNVINGQVAETYLLKDDANSAIEQCKRALALDPNFGPVHVTLGYAYLKQKNYDEAIAELQKAAELSDGMAEVLGNLGYGYAVSGRRSEAIAVLQQLEQKYSREEANEIDIGKVYAALGDKEHAFWWLEKAFQTRSADLREMRWTMEFASLHGDSRFADLLRRMGQAP
jgi:serine/threonine-protein kinase